MLLVFILQVCISFFKFYFLFEFLLIFYFTVDRVIFSVSDCLLLIHKNTTDFYILIYYPITLINQLFFPQLSY